MIVTVTLNPAVDQTLYVDRMVPHRKLRGTDPVFHPGGGGINVARAIGRLGGSALALWMGGGLEGRRLGACLSSEGVANEVFPIADETRRNLHVEERATGDLYRLQAPGARVSEAEAALLLDRIGSIEGIEFLVISGSLPPGLPAEWYTQLVHRAPPTARVVLDTSGEGLRHGLAGGVYLAKPNARELDQLAGRALADDAERVVEAHRLIRDGRVQVLAVSLADAGLLLVTRDGDERIVPPGVTVKSPVGAGDSTVAGMVLGLSRGMALSEAARFGVAAGTAAVMTPGTELCTREDTERLFAALRA